MPKVCKQTVDSLQPPQSGQSFLWDSTLRGFGVRITERGVKSYVLQYRSQSGKSRRHTIGKHGKFTPNEARKIAKKLLIDVAMGGDPAEQKKTAQKVAKESVTFEQLAVRYMKEYSELRKKPRSVKEDRRILDRHLIPVLGNKPVEEISRQDIARLHSSMVETVYQANRCLALLSKIFNLTERWELRPDGSNPCRLIEKYPEEARDRYLSDDELGRLGDALNHAERGGIFQHYVIPAIRLLLFTGCRVSEILTLKWENVDLKSKEIILPDSKTGRRKVQLNSPAIAILQALPRVNGWVFSGKKPGGHLVNLSKPWATILKMAKIKNLRLHDLRHSFASVGAGANLSLLIVGKLLGHKQATTTKRYMHLAQGPERAATELIGKKITEALNGENGNG